MQRFLSRLTAALAVPSLLLAAAVWVPQARAQRTGSGFVITGVENRDQILSYTLDFGGEARRMERYRLRIPAQDVAVAEVQINFAENFDGSVDPDRVRLEAEGDEVPLNAVFWNEEFLSLEMVAEEPIAAGQRIRVILSNVQNPRRPGLYRIQGRVLGTEANPIFRYVGLWIINIELAGIS